MKAVKIFVHFVHYLAVALFGAVVGSAFEYQVIDGTVITACLLGILIAVGSGLAIKFDDFGDHKEEDETPFMEEENIESEEQ